MKRKILTILIILLVPCASLLAQDLTTGKVGFSLADTAYEAAGLTFFVGSEFDLKNSSPGINERLTAYSFWNGARVSLGYTAGIYTASPFIMTQLFSNLTPKSAFTNGIDYNSISYLLMRARMSGGLENKFNIHKWALLNYTISGRLTVDFDTNTDNTDARVVPEFLFENSVSISGGDYGFSYFAGLNFQPYFTIGAPEYNAFKDLFDIKISGSVQYNIFQEIDAIPEKYKLHAYADFSTTLKTTKDDAKVSYALRDKNVLGYSGYDAESFIGLRGNVAGFVPTFGMYIRSQNSTRVEDQVLTDTFMGAKIGLGFQSGAWTFVAEYKGGQQINKGTAQTFVPDLSWNRVTMTASVRL